MADCGDKLVWLSGYPAPDFGYMVLMGEWCDYDEGGDAGRLSRLHRVDWASGGNGPASLVSRLALWLASLRCPLAITTVQDASWIPEDRGLVWAQTFVYYRSLLKYHLGIVDRADRFPPAYDVAKPPARVVRKG
ncbi:uncharacterized protein BO96DRAFT_333519 [Aspergillus niger CBS 101883]|uniref:Uncharacterized protein n=2 Tax=Aspergillus niger TaxID=5061 RepID=A2QA02_ASPNC|nr:uncharacterized protein BO96DRAFT_333519 [Aspergillus niger CBS 101883]XP_059599719.1 hypothetical protein An01g09710 [Aspergillus niger]PYH58291.1 hypothetical protein BO96DRAFT_333519 [Aspergillus niger CBS 101883]CAK37154.1 hypothetical protein An01g09710 [Aspergillus niger]